MTLTRARVIRGAFPDAIAQGEKTPARAREVRPRRVPGEVVDAHLAAAKILAEANDRAAAVVRDAIAEARRAAAAVTAEARAVEQAKGAALFLKLRADDERRAERDLDRSVVLAIVLAERLLGEALERQPERIASLARQALAEARGARRVRIEAHPLDAEALRAHVLDIVSAGASLEVVTSTDLSRGSLRVHTNLGSLDAQLTPQLERLAAALRDALKPA